MAKILLVDNIREDRIALYSLLQQAGHDVHESEDGAEAMECLRQQNYDLVITEVILRETDGPALLDYLEKRPDKIPVIALSGGNSQMPADIALLLVKAKANAVMSKPIDEQALLALTEKLLTPA
jgi:CheY-like chemotaxis protein